MINLRAMPAISQSSFLRLTFVFMAYVAQGLPVGLFFYAIPAWLAANGVSALVIGGYVGATALPWTLKFVNGFLMDRFTFLAMGKRRAWLMAAQFIMMAGLLVGALINPGIGDIAILTAISVLINTATTFQDVAIDGLAVDLVPEQERPRANGLMFGGQAVGIAFGTALTGFMMANFGVSHAFISVACLIALTLSFVIAARERPGERLLPWTSGEASEVARLQKANAWWPLFKSVWRAMINRDSMLLAFALMMNGVIFGLYLTAAPIIATNFGGWSDEGFSALTGLASLVAGLGGILIFGLIVDRIGTRVGGTSGMLFYAAVGLVMALSTAFWGISGVIIAFVFLAFSADIYVKVSTCSTAMRLCDVKVAATQFTLYMALSNAGVTLSGFMTGPLDRLGGSVALCLGIMVAGLIGAAAFAQIKTKSSNMPAAAVPAFD